MTWTYDGAPGSGTAAQRRDTVRLLIGDTDTNDQQITDEEIAYFLGQANDRPYYAAVSAARAIAASYARLVDNSLDQSSVSLSQLQTHYAQLATRLEKEAKTKGSALGLPSAGGISRDAMKTADDVEDRPDPAFRTRQFRNPPRFEDQDYPEDP